jgi:hypothetical protein
MIDPVLFGIFFYGFVAGILCGTILSQKRQYPRDAAVVTEREKEWLREVDWWPGISSEIERRLLNAMSIKELAARGNDMVKLAKINEALEKIRP